MFVGDNGSIYVETAHPAYPFLINFLISCTEPVSRTHHIEHYRLDASSLSAATAEGIYSCEMIRHFLRYFRFNEKKVMTVDLTRYKALLSWASSSAAENDPASYRYFHFTCTQNASCDVNTSKEISNDKTFDNGSTSVSVKRERVKADVNNKIKSEDEEKEFTRRRTLKLSLPTTSKTSSSASVVFANNEEPNGIAKVSGFPTDANMHYYSNNYNEATSLLPIVHYAVTNPQCLQPLPSLVEEMLREEEEASRMLIVLQPRLRRFGSTQIKNNSQALMSRETTTSPSSSSSSYSLQSPDQLYYFIISRERRHLESVMEGIVEYLEPVMLHGVARYIISDIDRDWTSVKDVETQQLFHNNSSNNRNNNYLGPLSEEEYKEMEEQEKVDKMYCTDNVSNYYNTTSFAQNLDMNSINRASVLRRLFSAMYNVEPPENNMDDNNYCNGSKVSTINNYESVKMARKASNSRIVYKCQIKDGMLRAVKEQLFKRYGVRADCFYDYLQDHTIHVPQLTFSPRVHLRHYQTASLERFRHNQKAHHGVVVLPCGAGKTLTGIGAAVALQKRTIVMCINNMSVFQWQREFVKWTNLSPSQVTICTAKEKQMPGEVFITTYNMIIAKRFNEDNGIGVGRSAKESEAILSAVMSEPWGLLILDEVHTALALHFQEVLDKVKHKCVLGLSATLLREDDKIADLRHLVGPKLYEANWLELTKQGYLAEVECAEIQCPLPMSFFLAYHEHTFDSENYSDSYNSIINNNKKNKYNRKAIANKMKKMLRHKRSSYIHHKKSSSTQNVYRQGKKAQRAGINSLSLGIAACNPFKLWCTQALLEFHRHRSPPDKVIIYCDYLADVRYYATMLHLPFMDQRTSEAERTNLLQYFQYSDTVNAIILTRVGDVALDLPCASVIIQISGLGASRRQEAQRLGRILRPKPASLDNTCAYFYTLVSQDTHEIRTSYERQSWLRDQGFAYRVINCSLVLAEYARVHGELCCIGPPQWWFQVEQNNDNDNDDDEEEEEEDYEEENGQHRQSVVNKKEENVQGVLNKHVNNKRNKKSCKHVYKVHHNGCWWTPFSPAASTLLQHHFNRGKDGCVLDSDILGDAAKHVLLDEIQRHASSSFSSSSLEEMKKRATSAMYKSLSALSASMLRDSWKVEFSSVDAPNTFGTVIMGNTASPEPWQVRRITFGVLDQPHHCLPCTDEAETVLCANGISVSGSKGSNIYNNKESSCVSYALEQLLNRRRSRLTKSNTNKAINENSDDNESDDEIDSDEDDEFDYDYEEDDDDNDDDKHNNNYAYESDSSNDNNNYSSSDDDSY